jgi:hypothetical protein
LEPVTTTAVGAGVAGAAATGAAGFAASAFFGSAFLAGAFLAAGAGFAAGAAAGFAASTFAGAAAGATTGAAWANTAPANSDVTKSVTSFIWNIPFDLAETLSAMFIYAAVFCLGNKVTLDKFQTLICPKALHIT